MVPLIATAGMVRPRVFPPAIGLWVLLAVVAVANGVFRETVIVPRTTEYRAHVLSTALLVGAILLLSGLYFGRTSIAYTRAELLLIGLVWTVGTVGFEFLVGYVEGTPVSTTLGQYDVFAGQVWVLVPFTLLLSPLLFGWVLQG